MRFDIASLLLPVSLAADPVDHQSGHRRRLRRRIPSLIAARSEAHFYTHTLVTTGRVVTAGMSRRPLEIEWNAGNLVIFIYLRRRLLDPGW